MVGFRHCVRALGGVVIGAATAAQQWECQAAQIELELPENDSPYNRTWGTKWCYGWDNPGERGLPTDTKKGQRQIIMIRHGQYQNEDSSDDSIRTLTDLGKQQAHLTGKWLKENMGASSLFTTDKVQHFYVSNMARAKETADIILEELNQPNVKVTEDAILRERFPCDVSPPYPKKASESSMKVAEQAFEKYFHRPRHSGMRSTEFMVGHANMIRYFVCRSLQLPPEAWLRISLAHCSLTSIQINGEGTVKINMLGSCGHLPGEMHTTRNLP